MAEFSLAVKSINQEFLAIPRHFFFVEYLIFSLLFFFPIFLITLQKKKIFVALKFILLQGRKHRILALLSGKRPSELGLSTKMLSPRARLAQMFLHTPNGCREGVWGCGTLLVALSLTSLLDSTFGGWLHD